MAVHLYQTKQPVEVKKKSKEEGKRNNDTAGKKTAESCVSESVWQIKK
jgi:hypothetical protein